MIFTKLLADNDGSSVGKTATGDGTNVYHHNSNGICGNHIIANVAKDRCERRTGKAPDNIIYHSRRSNFHKVPEQNTGFRTEIFYPESDIGAV